LSRIENKFFRLFDHRIGDHRFGHKEVGITTCAVSRMANIDSLPKVYGYYFVEPNKDWREWRENVEKNPESLILLPKQACVKVYSNTGFSETRGEIQKIEIPMEFFGKNVDECYGEIQFRAKYKEARNGKIDKLDRVVFGRNQSFDTRIGEWAPETKSIVPKKGGEEIEKDDSHGYISLRIFHQCHKPEKQPDWHFEPVYVRVDADGDFYYYRINAEWQETKITILTTLLLDNNDPQIPAFLRK